MDFLEGLDPNKMTETRVLAFRWGFDGTRNLEKTLVKAGITLLPVGKGINLVRNRDIWDAFDHGKPAA